MAMACGFEVRAITLVAAPNSNGSTLINLPAYPTEVDHIKLALLAAAGMAAEYLFCHRNRMENVGSVGHCSDEEKCEVSLRKLGQGGHFHRYVKLACMVLQPEPMWQQVTQIVEMLKSVETVTDAGVIRSIASNVPVLPESDLKIFRSAVSTNSIW